MAFLESKELKNTDGMLIRILYQVLPSHNEDKARNGSRDNVFIGITLKEGHSKKGVP